MKPTRLTCKLCILSLFVHPSLTANESEEAFYTLPPYILTGSHLPITDEMPPVPLSVIESETLEQWGYLSPIESFRKQPFAYGTTNTENDSNSGTGSASANIHGLGNLSTLTLINGRRAGGNSAVGFQHGGFADLNLIPSAAIREIQIATGGTSVAYGSDAAAGTVNILLQDRFVGGKIDANYSDTSDDDASEKAFSFLVGHDLGESTRIVVLGSWYQRNALYARDRAISKNTNRRDQGGQNQSSPTFPGKLTVSNVDYVLKDGIYAPDTTAGNLTDNYAVRDPNVDVYNFSEEAVAVPAVERNSVMANLSHDISPNLEVWSEFLYTDSEFQNGLAPAAWQTIRQSGFDFNPALMDAVRVSPHLPGGLDPNTINKLAYRSFELGKLENLQEKEALRGLLGLRGRIGEWNWETAVLYTRTQLDEHWSGVADQRILDDRIESGAFNPFALAFTSGTIPGTTTPYSNATALASAEASPTNHYDETYWSYDAKFNGTLLEIPHGNIDLASGIEYRGDSLDVRIDELFETGSNLGGPQRSSFSADRRVMALFTEAQIPLVESKHQKLDLRLSLRNENYRDDYAGPGNTNHYDALVYKAALSYQINDSLQLRAAYGTSFRAPTLYESYGGNSFANPIYNDPLGYTPPSSRINTLLSSNPDLDPEQSSNLNLGFILEPERAQGWRLSINYYRIESEAVIVNGAQYFVEQNALGQGAGFGTPGNFDPDAPFADKITRNSADGNLVIVYSEWFNAAQSETDGIDYKISYKAPITDGFWRATFGLNQTLTYKIKASENSPYQSYLGRLVDPRAAGGNLLGRGSIPKYKAYLECIWSHQGLTLGSTLNYIHSLDDNAAFTIDGNPRTVDSWTTLDLFVSYQWPYTEGAWLSQTRLTAGIDNVTNEPPPFAAGAFADGYDSSLYSLEGRRFRISMSREF